MAGPPSPVLGLRDLGVAAAMNLVFGLNIIAVKMSVGVTEPFTAALLRLAVVALVCLPAIRIVPGRMKPLLLLGFVNGALFLVVVNWSMAISENVGALAIASQLGVPFSLILAIVFLREAVHWPRIAGTALSFAGVALMLFDPRIAGEWAGIALTTTAALIWSFGSLLQRRLAGVPVLTIYAWVGVVGAVGLLPVVLWLEPAALRAVPDIRLGGFAWIVFAAVGSTIVGQGGMAWLLSRHPVSVVSPLTLASPVIAIVASAWFFGNDLTPLMIAGGMMALAGVAVITVRSARAA